jgi:hypothetical protein
VAKSTDRGHTRTNDKELKEYTEGLMGEASAKLEWELYIESSDIGLEYVIQFVEEFRSGLLN